MEPDSSIALYLIFFCALLFSAFFSMSESAIINMHDNKIRKMAEDGSQEARLLAWLTEKPSQFLASMQAGATWFGLFAAVIAAYTFLDPIFGVVFRVLFYTPLTPQAIFVVAVTLLLLALAFVVLVLCRFVPRRIGAQHSERIALLTARPMWMLYQLGRPFVALLTGAQNLILRLFGIDPNWELEEVTEEEIRMMIDASGESGHIEEGAKDMINNIFEFDDHTAADMMTHRTEIEAVELGAPLSEVIELAATSGYSRIPVYEDDLDSIAGILHVKDLLRRVTGDPGTPFNLSDYLRDPLYVLETANCKSLLGQLKSQKIQMAVVVDEYGGTSGIVTMEDLLESIVGSIQDEYDEDEEEDIVAQTSENSYMVDGLAPLEDVAKFFSLEIDDEEEESDTIGGYITNLLGYIPVENQCPQVKTGNVLFTVAQVEERRIAKLQAEIVAEPAV